MQWYLWRKYRIAYSPNRGGIVTDGQGRWRHLLLGIYVLVARA